MEIRLFTFKYLNLDRIVPTEQDFTSGVNLLKDTFMIWCTQWS